MIEKKLHVLSWLITELFVIGLCIVMQAAVLVGKIRRLETFLAYFPCSEKINGGLLDHLAVCICVCMSMYPPSNS
jgi:hypothetical protein